MRSEAEELAFVIDHYNLPIPAAARRLLLQRARLAHERQRRRLNDPSIQSAGTFQTSVPAQKDPAMS